MVTTIAEQSIQQSSHTAAKLVATLSGHTKSIITVSFSPDGETIATGSEDGTVRLWNGRTGHARATLNIRSKARTMRLEWSPDARSLAVKNNYAGEKIQIWDVQTAKLKATLDSRDEEAPLTLAWSPDGRTLLTTGYEGTARLWDAETGLARATLLQDPPCPKKSFLKSVFAIKRCAGPGWVTAYFVADGGVLTLSRSNRPKLWDSTGRLKRDLPLTQEEPEQQYFFYPSDAILSPDRRLVARFDRNGVALLETSTGQVKHLLGDIGEPLDFSPDGRKLLVRERGSKVGSPCGQVRCDLQIYDVSSGQLKITFGKMSWDNWRYWSPDGTVIITVSGLILDTRTGQVIDLHYEACVPDRIFRSTQCDPFVFSADGRIALKLKDPLKLWSTDTGELLTRIEPALSPAAFSPTEARLLVTRGMDKRAALIWEIQL